MELPGYVNGFVNLDAFAGHVTVVHRLGRTPRSQKTGHALDEWRAGLDTRFEEREPC